MAAGLALLPGSLRAEPAALRVERAERLLVFAPHPDDETLAAAGLMRRVLERGGEVTVVFATAGDGFEAAARALTGKRDLEADDYLRLGRVRFAETQAAARAWSAGASSRIAVSPTTEARRPPPPSAADQPHLKLELLGFPDGALTEVLAQPSCDAPVQSPHTHATHAASAYCAPQLMAAVLDAMRRARPTLIVFSHPRDHHPDHHTLGMAVQRALVQYRAEHAPPRALAYLVHWPGWPPDSARNDAAPARRDRPLPLPVDFPNPLCLTLDPDAVEHKARALQAYATQRAVMAAFLDSFVRRSECFDPTP